MFKREMIVSEKKKLQKSWQACRRFPTSKSQDVIGGHEMKI
jgi:hypothetical protein